MANLVEIIESEPDVPDFVPPPPIAASYFPAVDLSGTVPATHAALVMTCWFLVVLSTLECISAGVIFIAAFGQTSDAATQSQIFIAVAGFIGAVFTAVIGLGGLSLSRIERGLLESRS